MSEEIIALLVVGLGHLVEYWRRNRNEKAIRTIETVERWASLAANATSALRVSGVIKNVPEFWEAWEHKFQAYSEAAGIRLSPRMRLLARQRAADEAQVKVAPPNSTTFEDLSNAHSKR